MGDIFGKQVKPENKIPSADAVLAYTEIYHRLLRQYKNEIQMIENMMEQLRQEREIFYLEKLSAIREAMILDEVSPEIREQWLKEVQKNMERSFHISEKLIQNYVTDNLEEFQEKFKNLTEKL